MLDFTKTDRKNCESLEKLKKSHGDDKVSDALKAIELAEKYPVEGGDFLGGQENVWFSSGCRSF